MPRLVRNMTKDGSCKYGLVRMDKIRNLPPERAKNVLAIVDKLKAAGVFEVAGKGDSEEAFVMKLKDIHTPGALVVYANTVMDYDPEFAQEVFELAVRARGRKDARHPTL